MLSRQMIFCHFEVMKAMRKFQFVLELAQGGPRVYHAETQNSWVVSEARDTRGKSRNPMFQNQLELNKIRS